MGAVEIRAPQAGSLKVCEAQPCVLQIGTAEAGLFQIGVAQVSASQRSMNKDRAVKIGALASILGHPIGPQPDG
jgi:hypothetical protein